MVVPSYFATPFRRGTFSGITDVANAIPSIVAEITGLADPWTLVSGDEYESPIPAVTASADQRSMRVLFSAISPTRLGFHVKDANGQTVHDGSFDITSNAVMRVFSGPHQLVVEFEDAGVKEMGYANILDITPFPISSLGTYVVGSTHRSAAGAVQQNSIDECSMNDLGGVQDGRMGTFHTSISGGITGRTTGGSQMVLACEIHIEPAANVFRGAGKLVQMVLVETDLLPGDQVTVPLDDGITGDFFILGRITVAANAGKLAVRAA